MDGLIRGLDDAALCDRVAQATALYFLDWSHPVSGMARERSGGSFGYDTEETVTTGGTGFGLLAQIVAAERGWRPAREILDRVERLVGFLERADRFDGVFPPFMNGTTGRAQPFSPGDDGGMSCNVHQFCLSGSGNRPPKKPGHGVRRQRANVEART